MWRSLLNLMFPTASRDSVAGLVGRNKGQAVKQMLRRVQEKGKLGLSSRRRRHRRRLIWKIQLRLPLPLANGKYVFSTLPL